MKCRVLNNEHCEISQGYSNNHNAVDVVGGGYTLDYIVAHSDGKVVFHQDGLNNMKGSTGNASYGNCVKIEHGNGYYTLYAHMQKGLLVKNGQYVKKGQKLGYMWDSGNARGKHLHFEVWKDDKRINPTPYLNNDLPKPEPKPVEPTLYKYKEGDVVTINGVYYTSTSTEKLKPAKTKGKITNIAKGARNPYLLENGNIGWVNDDCITGKEGAIKYLSNPGYKGVSIVDALNQISVDSSYNYRSKLAKANGISNYRGTAEQNTKMLNLLKQGKLIAA